MPFVLYGNKIARSCLFTLKSTRTTASWNKEYMHICLSQELNVVVCDYTPPRVRTYGTQCESVREYGPLPIVDIKVVLNASSENLNSKHVFPTPESPIKSSLNNKSYVFFAIFKITEVNLLLFSYKSVKTMKKLLSAFPVLPIFNNRLSSFALVNMSQQLFICLC